MTVRILECEKCGDSQIVDTWPGADSDDVLDQLVRSEEWTYQGDLELCPSCSEGDEL